MKHDKEVLCLLPVLNPMPLDQPGRILIRNLEDFTLPGRERGKVDKGKEGPLIRRRPRRKQMDTTSWRMDRLG